MTDRPDPFEDLEFETAEEIEAEEAVPALAAAPKASEAPAPKAEAPAAPATVEATSAPRSAGLVAYLTLAASGLAFAGTISVVVITVAAMNHVAPPSPERATLSRIEGLLNSQQARLTQLAASPAGQGPAPAGDLAALSAVVRANQQTIDSLPALLKQEVGRIRVPATVGHTAFVGRPAAAPAGTNLAEVIRAQQAIQRQLDALAGRMAKTTAACVAQNDGAIRYP